LAAVAQDSQVRMQAEQGTIKVIRVSLEALPLLHPLLEIVVMVVKEAGQEQIIAVVQFLVMQEMLVGRGQGLWYRGAQGVEEMALLVAHQEMVTAMLEEMALL
jgi:hypothetical protein